MERNGQLQEPTPAKPLPFWPISSSPASPTPAKPCRPPQLEYDDSHAKAALRRTLSTLKAASAMPLLISRDQISLLHRSNLVRRTQFQQTAHPCSLLPCPLLLANSKSGRFLTTTTSLASLRAIALRRLAAAAGRTLAARTQPRPGTALSTTTGSGST
ncbi:MAG: hypothetical protein H6668_05190 [Ardenticatenaceae bacterium]|nr:hypothetical protein [Ardenticatenaceae bacterium]